MTKNEEKLSFEYVNGILDYDPETGDVTWKVFRGSRTKIGKRAGTINDDKSRRTSYYQIVIDNITYRAHRIAWLLHYGKWPDGQIDHIDGDGMNNRIGNIRDVSNMVNHHNIGKYNVKNRRFPPGVKQISSGRYVAKVMVNYKQIYLGSFDTIAEAVAAHKEAKRKYHNPSWGEYATKDAPEEEA